MTASLAEPVNVAYNGPEEVRGRSQSSWGPAISPKVTFTVPSGYAQEKHLVTPTRLFRVTGYLTDPATVDTFSTADNTYIREYVRASSGETAAVTLAGQPVSWWKISGLTGGVKLEQSVKGIQREKTWLSSDSSSLVVDDGDKQTSTIVTKPNSIGGDFSVQTEVTEGTTLLSQKIVNYESSGTEYRIADETVFEDPSGSGGLLTSYGYYPSDMAGDPAGKLWWVSRADGSWAIYKYPGQGHTTTFTPFGSEACFEIDATVLPVPDPQDPPRTDLPLPLSPAAGFSAETARIRKTDSVNNEERLVTLAYPGDPNGALIRKSDGSSESPVANVSNDAIPDDIPLVGGERSVSYSQDIDSASSNRWLAGRTILSHAESGRAEYFEYSKTGDQVTVTSTTGFVSVAPVGSEGPTVNSLYFAVVPGLSERTISIRDSSGLVSRETLFHTGSAFSSARLEEFFYQGGFYHRTEIDGIEVHRIDRPDSVTMVETDAEGLETTTRFDEQGEVLWVEKAAGGGVPAIRTTYERAGTTTTIKTNGVVTSVTTVDGLGRTISSQDETGAITTYAYPSGGRYRVVAPPGATFTIVDDVPTALQGPVRVEEYNLDRSLRARSGGGWINEFHSVDTDGVGYHETVSTGSAAAHTDRKSTTYFDSEGNITRIVRPSPSGGGNLIKEEHYHIKGVPLYTSTVETDGSGGWISELPTKYFLESNLALETPAVALGGLRISGLDLNGSGTLTHNTTDRFSKREVSYVLVNGIVHRKTSDYSYPDSTGANPLVTETLESLGFVKVGSDSYSSSVKVTRSSAATGRSVTTTTLVTPASATVVTTEDDSATTAAADTQTTTVNGYIQSVARAGNSVAETYAYDSFGRIKQYTDARNAATFSYYENFQLSDVTDQLRGTASYEYYLPTQKNAGKVKRVTRPGGAVEETQYNDRGQVSRISGSGTYTRDHGYDAFGDMVTLTTYGTQTAVTRWTRQPGTGLVIAKRYDDGNPGSKGLDYQYTADGKVSKRTSARNVVTDYIYDAITRDLTNINYSGDSDLTPDVEFSGFDGFGRPTAVEETTSGTDAHVNAQTLAYNPYSGAVSIAYDAANHRWLKGVAIHHAADDAAGRPAGFEVLVGGTPVSSQTYHYDSLSRLDEVDSPELDSAITYLPGTNTLQGIAVTRGGNVIHSRSLAIDLLGRTVGVTNKAGASAGSLVTVASVGHAYDAAGRRENARREDGTWWDYDYNSRSEVTAAVKKTATDAAVPGLSYGYGYDGIGNRFSSASGTGAGVASRSYLPDALNQYDSITHNGKLGILTRSDAAVTATANAGVTVNGVDAEGKLHGIRLTATNGTTGKLATATVKRAGVTVGTASAWVPPATVVPTYDLDGNLLTDGRWTYTWDGECRLVSMLPLATALTGGAPDIELKFAYDWQGRRIGKTVVDKTSGTAVNSHMSYAYDHWNPVAEWKRTTLTGSLSGTALQRTHLWGPDIASSGKAPAEAAPDFQAAGGVAGLVATTYHNGAGAKDHFIPGYDANGNIIAWSDGSGALLQRMDYDPFGNAVLVEKTGTATLVAKLPPFGFSTKPQDVESGLLYYGYRYYDPVTGRWISRDPIEEKGGINLYGMVGNDVLNGIDYLGLELKILYKDLKLGKCGSFEVDRHFLFTDGAPDDGYIVMHVKSSGWKSGCTRGTILISGDYHEAFAVRKGAQTTLNMELAMAHLDQKDWGMGADRAAYGGNGDCTRGEYTQEVEARFYSSSETGYLGGGPPGSPPLPPGWGVDPGIPSIHGGVTDDPDKPGTPYSGAAPSTTDEPGFWGKEPLAKASAKVTVGWDCCPVSTDQSTKLVELKP